MNEARIDNQFCYRKQIALPNDVWATTKLEYSNDDRECILPKVIRVDFSGTGDGQVLVRHWLMS